LKSVNKAVLEALIKAGALDKFGGSRSQMAAGLKNAMKNGSAATADRQRGQMNLFEKPNNAGYLKDYQHLPDIAPWSEKQMSAYEKEVLGFYVTSNPLNCCVGAIDIYSTHNTSYMEQCGQNEPVVIGGIITNKRSYITKRGANAGRKMAVFVLEDLQGQVEVVLFPDVLEEYSDYLIEDNVVFVKGRVDCRREKPNVFADELVVLEKAGEKLEALWIQKS